MFWAEIARPANLHNSADPDLFVLLHRYIPARSWSGPRALSPATVMINKNPKPAGQRKVSPPGPTYMNGDQIGKAAIGLLELKLGLVILDLGDCY